VARGGVLAMAGETSTPNIGLQVPTFNQANWQVPINYNLNRVDLIFGGSITVPALTVTTLVAGNISGIILPPAASEVPSGVVPGSVYTLTHTPNPAAMLSFYVNGVFQPPTNYTLTANIVTLNNPTPVGATVYAQYFYST